MGSSLLRFLAAERNFLERFIDDLKPYLIVIFAVIGAASVGYAIFLGYLLAKAEDEGKRKAAKKRIFNTVAGLMIIVVLTVVLIDWDPPDVEDRTLIAFTNADNYHLAQSVFSFDEYWDTQPAGVTVELLFRGRPVVHLNDTKVSSDIASVRFGGWRFLRSSYEGEWASGLGSPRIRSSIDTRPNVFTYTPQDINNLEPPIGTVYSFTFEATMEMPSNRGVAVATIERTIQIYNSANLPPPDFNPLPPTPDDASGERYSLAVPDSRGLTFSYQMAEPFTDLSIDEFNLLVGLVFAEHGAVGRGTDYHQEVFVRGQIAVAAIVINRIQNTSNFFRPATNVTATINQPSQFAGGIPHMRNRLAHVRGTNPELYEDIKVNVRHALAGVRPFGHAMHNRTGGASWNSDIDSNTIWNVWRYNEINWRIQLRDGATPALGSNVFFTTDQYTVPGLQVPNSNAVGGVNVGHLSTQAKRQAVRVQLIGNAFLREAWIQ